MILDTVRRQFDTRQVMRDHPPKVLHPHKRYALEVAMAAESPSSPTVEFARWDSMWWADDLDATGVCEFQCRPDLFTYADEPAGWTGWHLNFADPDLFAYYGGRLLAQDEMQVAEHPVLASVREALLAQDVQPLTIMRSKPTPCTLTGVERRCVIKTDANADQGRPEGLYGNRFAAAPIEVIRRAISPVDPPTISNIVAMSAPPGGRGEYTSNEIEQILATLVTGFNAARHETLRLDPTHRTAVHTGFWGCGAFGGNRHLTVALQIVAARLSGIERLVFHAFDEAGQENFKRSIAIAEDELGSDDPRRVIEQAHRMGFRWGVSDGN